MHRCLLAHNVDLVSTAAESDLNFCDIMFNPKFYRRDLRGSTAFVEALFFTTSESDLNFCDIMFNLIL